MLTDADLDPALVRGLRAAVTPVAFVPLLPDRCPGCPLAPTRRGFVPGCGPFDARLVVVGEAPGREEIAADPPTPFIGPSGRIVRRGLGPQQGADAFITNVRKCLPPAEETPEVRAASIAHCGAAYLQPELDRLTAALFVQAVGADAAEVVAGVVSIMEAHGSVFTRAEADAMREAHAAGEEVSGAE